MLIVKDEDQHLFFTSIKWATGGPCRNKRKTIFYALLSLSALRYESVERTLIITNESNVNKHERTFNLNNFKLVFYDCDDMDLATL